MKYGDSCAWYGIAFVKYGQLFVKYGAQAKAVERSVDNCRLTWEIKGLRALGDVRLGRYGRAARTAVAREDSGPDSAKTVHTTACTEALGDKFRH